MISVSDADKLRFQSGEHQNCRIDVTLADTSTVTINPSDIMIGSLYFDKTHCDSSNYGIGSAVASEFGVTIKKDNFSSTAFAGGIAKLYVGFETMYLMGTYIIDSFTRNKSTITLSGMDFLMRFNQSASGLTAPFTLTELVSTACTACGVTCATTIADLPNGSITVNTFAQSVTWRDILQKVAQITCTNASVNANGELEFVPWAYLNDTSAGVALTETVRYSSDIQGSDFAYTGVKYTNSDGIEAVMGTEDTAIDVRDNYLIETDIETVIENIYNIIIQISYRPYTMSIRSMPYLECGDTVTVTDSDGATHISVVSNINQTINGECNISAKGETDVMGEYLLSTDSFARQLASASSKSTVAYEAAISVQSDVDAVEQAVGEQATKTDNIETTVNNTVTQVATNTTAVEKNTAQLATYGEWISFETDTSDPAMYVTKPNQTSTTRYRTKTNGTGYHIQQSTNGIDYGTISSFTKRTLLVEQIQVGQVVSVAETGSKRITMRALSDGGITFVPISVITTE